MSKSGGLERVERNSKKFRVNRNFTGTCREFLALLTILVVISGMCLILAPSHACAVGLDWYVNGTSGDNSYDGTSPDHVSGTVGPKATIQAGINAAAGGDNVNVAAGTYDIGTQLAINKSLTLLGTSGSGSTIITGGDPYTVWISATDVDFSGFTVTNPSLASSSDISGIVIQSSGSPWNVRVHDNIIHDVGDPDTPCTSYGRVGINIGFSNGGDGPVEVDHNEIYNIKHTGNSGTVWANGICVWGGDVSKPANQLNIHDNYIHDISCPQARAAGISLQSEVKTTQITNNRIENTKDFGIELRGDSQDAIQVLNNQINGSGTPGINVGISCSDPYPDDIQGNTVTSCKTGVLATDPDPGYGVVNSAVVPVVHSNKILGNQNYGMNNTLSETASATKNWWGSVYGPTNASNPKGTGDAVSDNVTFDPWCTNADRTEMVSRPSALLPVMAKGIFGIPVTASETSTPYIRAADEVVIVAASGANIHTIKLPTGMKMSKESGGDFATADLKAEYLSPGSLSGFNEGTTVYAGLQWGIPGQTMLFDSPVTIGLFVGTGMNGESLLAMRSVTGNSNWGSFGIVSSPPPVSGGYVVFEASRASCFAAVSRAAAAPGSSYYFAEGYTGEGFQEYLCVGNPNADEATVNVTYLFPFGETQDATYTVPGNSRVTVDVNSVVGPNREVSMKLQSKTDNLVAERPMYFNYTGSGYDWPGGHDVVGATALSTEWYFAEGYTGPGFDNYVCVLNPGDTTANLTFRFQTQEAGEIVKKGYSVPAHSRSTFKVNEILGNNYQNSLKLESDQPVVAERPMYFRYLGTANRGWTGGHCVMGAPAPSTRYYFAEGTTRDIAEDGQFEEWLCLQNPNASNITVNATYHLGVGQGDEVHRSYTIEGGKRATILVSDEVGKHADVSVFLTSDTPFMAERPIYFNYRGRWPGGHCVIGSTAVGDKWYFAEGYTGENFEEWLCLQNPGTQDATVQITYYTQDSRVVTPDEIVVPAGTRQTIYVNENLGPDMTHSTRIVSSMPIVVERPMYFNFKGIWTGGHDVVGHRP